jgi:hypothetical protein
MNSFEQNTIQGGYKMQQINGHDYSNCGVSYVDIEIIKDKTLSMYDKVIYSIICSHATSQIRECSLNFETIAEESGCPFLRVEKSLKALIKRGVLERIEYFDGNEQKKISVYKLIGYRAPCYRDAKSMPTVFGNTGRS